jgi:hypothetical protein
MSRRGRWTGDAAAARRNSQRRIKCLKKLLEDVHLTEEER